MCQYHDKSPMPCQCSPPATNSTLPTGISTAPVIEKSTHIMPQQPGTHQAPDPAASVPLPRAPTTAARSTGASARSCCASRCAGCASSHTTRPSHLRTLVALASKMYAWWPAARASASPSSSSTLKHCGHGWRHAPRVQLSSCPQFHTTQCP